MFGLHYVNFPPGYENRHSPGQTVEKEKQFIRNCLIFFFLTQQENLQNGKLNIFLSHFSLYRKVEDKISEFTNLSFAMVKYVIVLLFGSINNCLVAHTNCVYSLNLDIWQASKHLNGVDHVSNFFQAFAESIKLAKDVVLARTKMMKKYISQIYLKYMAFICDAIRADPIRNSFQFRI